MNPVEPAAAADATVIVSGVLAGAGRVYVSLCSGGLDPASCAAGQTAEATGDSVAVRFPAVPDGVYAVAAFQDLNGNGRLDRSAHGLPLEPYGFSNGAGRTASPRFDRAAVTLQGSATVRVQLQPLAGRR